MANRDHLKPYQFKPGQSGNPKGRPPKGETLTEILREKLESVDVETKDGRIISRKDAVVEKLYTMALNGDRDALKYLFDRIDGKPTTVVDVDAGKIGNIIIKGGEDEEGL